MRALVQRVHNASVSPKGHSTRTINKGLCIFIGISITDEEKEIKSIVDKIVNLRIFPGKENNERFHLSVKDIEGELLIVSQFTLYASTNKGKRPSFTVAAKPDIASKIFFRIVEEFSNSGLKVETGIFGSDMDVEINNYGPMTLIIDSKT